MTQEEHDKLIQNFNRAKDKIHQCLTATGGQQAEARYGQAFQALVRAGLAVQIKKKYRQV